MDELVQPEWRNHSAYARSLGDDRTKAVIVEHLAAGYSNRYGLKVALTPQEEVAYWLPRLIADLRLTNLKDYKYWILMLALTLVFLIAEITIVGGQDMKSYVGNKIVWALIFLLFSLIVLFVYYLWEVLQCHASGLEPKLIFGLKPSNLHSIPVLFAAIGLLFINLYMVMNSGWSESPLLPALLSIALVVIGLPRENSKAVIFGSLTAFLLSTYAFRFTSPIEQRPLQWGGAELYAWINWFTFAFSAISTFVLRQISSRKVGH